MLYHLCNFVLSLWRGFRFRRNKSWAGIQRQVQEEKGHRVGFCGKMILFVGIIGKHRVKALESGVQDSIFDSLRASRRL